MYLDETVIVSAFIIAMCLSFTLGASLYKGSFKLHKNLYNHKVAILVNATASALRNSTSFTLYLPEPVSIVNGRIGEYFVNASGIASGTCIIVENINGAVRVRNCGQ